MGHLQNYEEAKSEIDKALAALKVSEAKSAKARAWKWAGIAANHAEAAGIVLPYGMLGGGRRPDTETLRAALIALKEAEPESEFHTDLVEITSALNDLACTTGLLLQCIAEGGYEQLSNITIAASPGKLVVGTSDGKEKRTYILTVAAVEVRHE